MIGTWKGYYKFKKDAFQKAIGFEKTGFTINITSFDGKIFKGIVNDNKDSGGMEGTGEIIGEVTNAEISFRKIMPSFSVQYKSGKRKTFNKKHPTIYYSGKLSDDQKEANGTWWFKLQIAYLFGIIPIPYKPANGIWHMQME